VRVGARHSIEENRSLPPLKDVAPEERKQARYTKPDAKTEAISYRANEQESLVATCPVAKNFEPRNFKTTSIASIDSTYRKDAGSPAIKRKSVERITDLKQ
jgi:hypothetical protein